MAQQAAPPIRVLLIDPQCIFRLGLEKLIHDWGRGMEIAGKFSHCSLEVFSQLEKLNPDIILFDPYLDIDDGINAIRQLITATKAKIIVLTGVQDAPVHDKLMLAGAKGIVDKKESKETLLRAIDKVHHGGFWLDPAGIGRLIVELSSQKSAGKSVMKERRKKTLTPREENILLALISNGAVPAKTLARILHISESTLRNHLSSIYEKSGVTSRLALLDQLRKAG
jgi:two-component system, NarL family, nitrate/nitrite response regulator NarL